MTKMSIRGISLNVKVTGHGNPLALMHGGPGADHHTMESFRPCADQFTLVFYDHRCNGRSTGAEVSSMTWENLTADADALRQALGFEKWAVLGHSFGGMVALEYALRYPNRLSHLVLLDTCGESKWAMENAPEELAKRGFSPKTVDLARRFFNGQIAHHEMMLAMMKFGRAYFHHPGTLQMMHICPRVAVENATRSAQLWVRHAAEGLECHAAPGRDQNADTGPGGKARLPVPAGTPGGARSRDTQCPFADH